MCHQSVGLIARHLEANGLPTVTVSSAWSITASVNPPRSVFVNYPLGHTAGRPNEPEEQLLIARSALELLHAAPAPGEIMALPLQWSSSWKTRARTRGDTRTERQKTPQWERPGDAAAAGVSTADRP